MFGFALLVAHMLGDYILQNDWMAANKSNPRPGPKPPELPEQPNTGDFVNDVIGHTGEMLNGMLAWCDYNERRRKWRLGHLACTVHCLLYTLGTYAVLAPFYSLPWWFYAGTFLVHWPIDRFRLAYRWMTTVSGQAFFASDKHPMFPISIVLVDNTFHLLTFYLLAAAAGMQ